MLLNLNPFSFMSFLRILFMTFSNDTSTKISWNIFINNTMSTNSATPPIITPYITTIRSLYQKIYPILIATIYIVCLYNVLVEKLLFISFILIICSLYLQNKSLRFILSKSISNSLDFSKLRMIFCLIFLSPQMPKIILHI